MGKTNLLPSMTYFTAEELSARKVKAREAGLSLSNFNRMELGYSILKQGKPRKNLAPFETSNENNSEVEMNTTDEFLELLPTENDLENAFADITIFIPPRKNEEINLPLAAKVENSDEVFLIPQGDLTQPSLF